MAPWEKPRDGTLELPGGQRCQEEGCSYPGPVCILEGSRGLPATPPGSRLLAGKGERRRGRGIQVPLALCVNVFMCRCMSLSRHRVGWRHSALALPSKSTPPLDEWGSTRIGHSLCLQCSGTERRGKPRSRSYCPPHLFIGLYKPGNPLLKTVPCPLYIGDLGLWERLLV